jgi:hypothetical protein
MARKSKSYGDYMDLAAKKGLIFAGDQTPGNVVTATTWRCANCGNVMKKTYRTVNENPFGCPCQKPNTVQPQAYFDLAAKLGIQFLAKPGSMPQNSHVKVPWMGPSGKVIQACYHDLGYGKASKALLRRLGLDVTLDETFQDTAAILSTFSEPEPPESFPPLTEEQVEDIVDTITGRVDFAKEAEAIVAAEEDFMRPATPEELRRRFEAVKAKLRS